MNLISRKQALVAGACIAFLIGGQVAPVFAADIVNAATATPSVRSVTGTVVDQNGDPIIGANVVVKGTQNGTITDFDGNFKLDAPQGAVLEVSYIGYITKEVKADKAGRLDSCRKEVEFALARKELAEVLVKELEEEKIPLRVTHNDTKINNILMDETTNQPVCIIDLDTIMPGAAAYDFGDSIRFGASNAAEDEKDLSKVFMRLDLFEAYARGYLRTVGKKLSEAEARSLALGAIVITYETGIRFLGDYLNGDTYFKTAYPEHNLVRARTQLKLVEDMEAKKSEMLAIVEKYWKEAQEN